MTDITEQDLRDAREWAEDFAEMFKYDNEVSRETRAAVNYILATVDAPAPTLAEDLRTLGALLEEEGGAGAKSTCWARDLAARAEQIEQELDQARAEVGRLNADLDAMIKMVDSLNDDMSELRGPQPTPVHPSDQQANTQETLSGSLPDPDDVPYGEAWLVELKGCRHTAVRVPGRYWWVWRSDSGYAAIAWCSDITLVSRLVPAPRQVTTWEELDALALYTVIRGANDAVCEKGRQRPGCAPQWFQVGIDESESAMITFPATVLWTPEETA